MKQMDLFMLDLREICSQVEEIYFSRFNITGFESESMYNCRQRICLKFTLDDQPRRAYATFIDTNLDSMETAERKLARLINAQFIAEDKEIAKRKREKVDPWLKFKGRLFYEDITEADIRRPRRTS